LASIDEEPPDKKEDGKEEGQRSIADVAYCRCDRGDSCIVVDREELHYRRNEGERAEKKEDETPFEARREEKR